MKERNRLIVSALLATFLHISHGCQMENVTLWTLPVVVEIEDIFEGIVLSRSTSDIEEIDRTVYGEATIGGPYFDLSIVDSQFIIRTNELYKDYEEIEVASRVTFTVYFICSGGTNNLVFWINIIDTNNNAPQFIPTDEFEYHVTPPLPPDFLVSGCLDYITVRDIDLTTLKIDFSIEENPHFEIEYDESASTVPKEFKAQLRTKTFIRSLPEPVTLTINATDVDLTDGPRLWTTATVRIVADSEFQFPEEPIFGQTFYLANYTEDHQLNLFETISLQQGFDEYVNFSLEGEHAASFNIAQNGNQVLLGVVDPLHNDIWSERQIFLIVKAEREFTSGDTTTVIIQLPEETALQFERAYYEGSIINNGLQLAPLVLSQGYEGITVSARVVGEYSTHFTASVDEDLVSLIMVPLMDDIIDNNSFISLQVVATSDRSEATTVVNLEIIKDDNVTPVFDKSIYSGSYDPVTGLIVEQISFVQGFDETVDVELVGEHREYFQIVTNGSTITLTSSPIPSELYSQQNILISIVASKPRTVGANAAIHISLPSARELEFEESTYRGTVEGIDLRLQTILLHNGYDDDVVFSLSGDYASYFTTSNIRNQVTIELFNPLPEAAYLQNDLIMTLAASGVNAVTTSANILLDIIKDDTTTPSFSQGIYYGTYTGTSVEIAEISLQQGFDANVSFRLSGAAAQYFTVSNNGNNVEITLRDPIPEDVIFREKVLIFEVIADKALTVGANSAVLIRFPTELTDSSIMSFSKNTYIGTMEENVVDLESIVLDTGFVTGTAFFMTGEYAEHFSLSNTNNVVEISSLNTLPSEVVEDNDFVVLEIEARRERAVSVWTSVIIDFVKQEVIAPVFGQAYYTGVYTKETGLTFEETINLSEGYDETVTFALVGESAMWFLLEQNSNSLTLVLNGAVPEEVLENNNQLLFTVIANKTDITSGRAVISIDLPKDFSDSPFRFYKDFYKGHLEDGNLTLNDIILGDYTNDVNYTFTGDYVEYFVLTNQEGTFSLQLETPIPEDVLEETNVFVFTLEVQNRNLRTHTVIIIENLREDDDILGLKFEEPYYVGVYDESEGFLFDSDIRLVTGMDQSVVFALQGEHADWFGLVLNENSVTVTLTSTIPTAVLADNHQLVFVVTAQSSDSTAARATVVISLIAAIPEPSDTLGFDRVTYLGSIENNLATIPAITLSEGFTQGVTFTLHGELAEYFSLSTQGNVVTVVLQNVIPEQSVPTNRIILLEIQASAPQAVPAVATIVIEHIANDDVPTVVELIFAQTFYSGSYAVATGLSFPTPISLTQGYDNNVEFNLEGDNSQWFGLVRTGNSVTVTLTSSIPTAVLANNQQLVFVVTAQSPGSATARATVVISLIDAFPETSDTLGFDRVTYVGSIENNQATIPAITLSEGFTQGVTFTLYGELAEYFSLSTQGNVVTVVLQNVIPEQSVPTNRIILLEIQASAPQAVPAVATIVIEHIANDDVPTVVELIFAQTFYSGSYAVATGLSFPTPISLTQGYDNNVEFNLEGDNSQWFGLVRTGNSVTVTLTSSIPTAVLANNQQLVFVVTAQSPGSATARATVVISLIDAFPETSDTLGFDRVTYVGSIENNQATIPAITLSEGFTQGVTFTLYGELAEYFSLSTQGNVVTVVLQNVIPEQSVPTNRIILLEIQASAPQAVPAVATIVIEHIANDDVPTVVELIFAQTFYSGSYAVATGLSFPTPISLTQGYDNNVEFNLEGDNSQWFGLVRTGNSVTVTLTSSIPTAVLANNQQLVFVVTAQSPGSATARATVVISLIDAFPETSDTLGFDRVTYVGSIENNQATIPAITLSEGFTQGVTFTLYGELAEYFSLSTQGNVVTVVLQNVIPEQSVPTNRIILLEIQASAPQAVPAVATIVIEHIANDDVPTVVELIFAQTFYSGSYAVATGLSFPTPISLTQGYDNNVEFNLEGDNSQWFGLVRTGNSVTVTLTSSIPTAVLANNQQLVFVVTAQSPGSATARATVVISLIDAFPETSDTLGFDRVTYVGSIENNQATIPAITLSEGFTQGVTFTLYGELAEYFSLSTQGNVVTVVLQNVIPEQSVPTNRIILLEIQASAPQAVPAVATIVIEHIANDDVPTVVELIFAQTFYSGSYAVATGLSFPTPISLTQGYDNNVEFNLEGDNSQWFGLVRTGSSVTVTLTSSIPTAVLANNQQLVFVVTAQSPGSATARATVVISLIDAFPETSDTLGFDRVTYVGSIENNQATIPAITLSEGFTQGVTFTLYGELAEYFSLSTQGNVVTVVLQNVIPEQSVPTNRIILLEIQASAPQAVPAVATIVIEHIANDDVPTVVELIFAQTFYSGSYAVATGLSFPTPISLTQGYDNNVEFNLEGDNSQWFGLVRTGNSVTVTLTSSIPTAVLANNQQLVFVVTAQSPGSATARATVVISLIDAFPETSDTLGFDRVTYVGSIENNQATIPAITLSEGFTQGVTFTLYGELAEYFSLSTQGNVVTVVLQNVIPEQSVPTNRIILLEIQASAPQAVPAVATIVIEHIANDDVPTVVELIFAQTFYSGSYAVATGLSFPTPISLTQGYDNNVEFNLEGDNSQWFGLVRTGNSVTVTLTSSIPTAVLANNQQLVFVVTAQSPGSATARATVVISLIDAFPETSDTLGFDRVTYVGSIENNQATIPAITLSEGFTQGVTFTLYGELAEYFSLSTQGNVVTVVLQNVIPEQSVPTNRIILLEIQASAPQAVPAVATIVIEHIANDDVPTVVELIFAQTFYSGSYAVATGLSFPTPISLTQGYDNNVEFNLEGDNSQWFGLVRTGNSVTVTLTSSIPTAVLANNQQLVFVVTAQSPGSATARATVVISLIDAFPETSDTLGFDRVTYVGSIENNQATIPAITLSEGFTQGVTFTLYGELAEYFSLSTQGNVVTVVLQNVIPEQSVPTNRIILLEIQASAPQAVPAVATIVIEHIANDDVPTVVELIFAQTFYSGSYAVATGLSFPTPISLTQGYDNNVEFNLEGDNSQWFGLVRTGNSVTVTLTSSIPTAVLANNQQLVFVVTAQSPGSATARATVVISLIDAFPETSDTLGFDRVTYVGSIENNQATIPAITLSEGFTQGVTFTLYGELAEYFSLSTQGNVVTVVLQNVIPEQSVPTNRIILLEIQASAPQAVPAVATIVIEHIANDDVPTVVELIFAQTFYSGSYAVATGLSFPTPISLTQGYDNNVEFNLEGDNSQWFGLVRTGNSVTVTLTSSIPTAVLANNQQLVFVVTAQSPGSATARATVVISLIDAFPETSDTLGFDRVTYVGSIENNQATIPAITLSEGFTQGVTFTLYGELAEYFSLSTQGNVVTVVLQNVIPEQSVPTNRIILLEIQASAPQAVPAVATIVIEHIANDDVPTVVELIFAQTFYSGSYAVATGLSFPTPISLTQGYDNNVEFNLEGDNSQWFGLVRTGNSVTVTLTSSIPTAVLANNQQLVFVVTAQSPGSATARATVVISLIDAFPETSDTLGFDRVTYVGSIENNQATIPAITLSEGFTQGVTFTLYGELAEYFSLSTQGNVVTVVLQNVIPEQSVPTNRIILLEIQASAPQAVPAVATIVIEHIANDDVPTVVELIFAQTFYSGSYAVATGLSFPTPISLTQGYDNNVEFNLEGDNSQWFGLVRTGNSVTVTLTSSIPTAVLANNQQLVFVVTAQSPGSATARATVVISLIDAFPETSDTLGFDRVTYVGSIENNQATIPAITLSEGFTQGVTFTLYGELAEYFSLSTQGNVVTVVLQNVIPEQSVPTNRIILLEIQASAPQAVPAVATIVIEHIANDDVPTVVELIFAQTFYSGSYAVATGLSFPTPISLTQGYDNNVEFNLEGDNSQWFGLVRTGNSVTVTLTSSIPTAVLANNQQLVFVVTAQSPGSATARATVVISLIDAFPETSDTLGFDRVTYVGSIENNQATIPAITLSEGFTQGVTFTLYGELAEYFSLSTQGNVVTVVLQNVIPEQSVPTNRIILLEIQASAPQALPAVATIVIEHIANDDVPTVVELIFAQTFYSGSYAVATGLSFPTPISLTQGYDNNVEFNLEGDNSQWFGLVRTGNSVTVTLTSSIPTAVLANNQQLVFVVTAQSPGSATARATVVISLIDAFPETSDTLGFDRVTYVGSIENNQATIPAITLSEGFTQGVTFTLYGELAEYFSLSTQGNVVTVVLQNVIPEQSVPTNRIILLEIQASAPQAVPAVATIVIEHIANDDVPTVVELIFAQTFYSGSYAVATGLSFPTPISLTQGYDNNVEFNLEGDNSQWFGLVRTGNSVTVTLTSSIPTAVLANNQQLVFVVTAQSPGSATARATVVISLIDAFPETSDTLGFDRVTYVGSIENNQATIPAITLSEGFTQGVTFTLYGELAEYFSLSTQGNVVTVVLQNVIPEQSVPTNRIILLEIQASAPQALPAVATIVIEHIANDDVPTVVELIFAQTFYSGSYAVATGLSFPTPISLTQGYDNNVEFNLEGDNSQWFGLVRTGNSVTVTLTSSIPTAVLANNQQLVFVVTAQSPGSATARATVVISLIDAFPETSDTLGFDRVTYVGSIENNQATIPAITLSEGFTQGVTFTLYGELAEYFSLSTQGNVVTVVLQNVIPEQSVPTNRIILLEIQASAPQAVPAVATIVIEHIANDDVPTVVELIFAQTFYSGSYAVATGLSFPTPISLTQGYDNNVEFNLEGDNSQWFGLVRTGNSVTVTLTSSIPTAVLANNQQLVFVVTAQSPGSATARATVVISLIDAFPETSDTLGFDRVTYVGSIENNQATIPAITLSEGFTQGVTFTLYGELAEYFSLSTQGNVVTVVLQNVIPEQSVPTNRIILLEIQASAPQAVPAVATIVIEHIANDDVPTVVELIFAQTFYSGSYAVATGLSFPTPISLTQGYDNNVEFNLEGDNSQWFGLVRTGNSVTVTLTSSIPTAVLANNQQLVFVVTAQSPGSATARATVVISLIDAFPETSDTLGFDRVTYVGSIENNQATIPAITLSEGFTQGVTFTLYGELAEYFSLSTQGNVVTVVLQNVIPEQSVPTNRIILLEIQASAPQAVPAVATIVIEHIANDDVPTVVELIFAQTFYSGSYAVATGLSFPTPISLTQGYDNNVEFNLEGDNSQWFGLVRTGNSVTVTLTSSIPTAVLANNQQLVFVVTAQSPGSATARATVVISLIDAFPETSDTLGFDRVTYVGSIENNQATIPAITLSEGFTQGVTFTLYGELAEYFSLSTQGNVVTVVLQNVIPEQSVPTNRIILLEIQASAPQAVPAVATIVTEHIANDDVPTVVELIFAQTFYSGSYAVATGLSFPTPISLTQGYDNNVEFNLEGDNSQWFGLVRTGNSVTVTLTSSIPTAVLANNQQLVFVVTAQSPGSATARATVVISLIDAFPETSDTLGFDRVTYVGSIENNQATIPAITLSEGFTQGVTFTLYGELAEYFSLSTQGNVVTVVLQNVIPEQSVPTNRIILLEIQASAPQAVPAVATIVIEHIANDDVPTVVELIFAQTFYSGSYAVATGLSFPTPISLTQGYDNNVEFNLEGDNSQWFGLVRTGNSVTVTLTSSIPTAVLANNQQLVFVVTAQSPGSATARATVVISLIDNLQPEFDGAFEKVLFEGIIQNNVVSHEAITITGFSGSSVELHGEYSTLFTSQLSDGVVTVTASGSLPLPTETSFVTLELRAGTASAVLLLNVIHTDTPNLPTVTFSSPLYAVNVDTTHTGIIGQVEASADSGEAVSYSLQLDNDHLGERLSINNQGELHLAASVNPGVYTFNVVATTIFTQVQGTSVIHLTAEALSNDEFVMDPLIVLDVDEEEPHYDLLNGISYDNCHYTLTNRWPLDQTWIYVNETGLHTQSIDREHESIAFMPVSQVQVEVILHCQGDATRTKRSVTSDALAPYDYGTNKWILADTIIFNSRRSFLNLIVNDINDNYPIFVDKENEPIAVGYPVPELSERILPRSLAELQATDADIGENAALLYWSAAPELAVAPTSGFVHLRDGAILENGSLMTVHATDRNGEGLTGSIDIVVRLLNESYIAVVTVQDAFLDNEQTVISHLTEAVGYELKVLRSVVISGEVNSRKKRDITNTGGASLQLYVYGLVAREPVSVEQLTADISNTVIGPVIVTSTVSLQDHLEGQEICVIAGRDTGLLVATIILSVLLFIVLVLIAVWFFLRWRKNRKYNEFSDSNSLASRSEAADKFPRPESLPKPRLDIGELKKSERRLQEMLDAPFEEISVEPSTSALRNDAILDMPIPEPLTPIVIQSVDKLKDAGDESSEDEFGESRRPKRKSVVTFNEIVEKIIHVEDNPNNEELNDADPDYEIFKL